MGAFHFVTSYSVVKISHMVWFGTNYFFENVVVTRGCNWKQI